MAEPKAEKNKKPYRSPRVHVYGNIVNIVSTTNMGTLADGGAFPNTKTA